MFPNSADGTQYDTEPQDTGNDPIKRIHLV